MLQLYSVGTPIEEIARLMNMSPAVVMKTLKKNGLGDALYGDVLTDEQRRLND